MKNEDNFLVFCLHISYNQRMKKLFLTIFAATLLVPSFSFAAQENIDIDEILKTDLKDLSEPEVELLKLQLQVIILQLSEQIKDILDARASSSILSCPNLSTNMYVGSTGTEVTRLQTFLKQLGSSVYPEGEVTGKYGSLTRAAVERFQVKTNIFAPGKVGYGVTGPVTRETISEYCATNTVVITSNSDTNSDTTQVAVDPNNPVTISSTLDPSTADQLLSSFDPNSSSIFLQFLNPDQVTTNAPTEEESINSVIASPVFKEIDFVNAVIPDPMTIGTAYTLTWNATGFSGFDLVYVEGFEEDIHHFFGATVPTLGTFSITVPEDFENKEGLTLVVKHNNVIKDSIRINLN